MQQQYLEESERDQIFQNLKTLPENKKCMDCSKKNASWSSVYLGLFLCYDCAGTHRQYGVQVSFVKSLDLDKWTKRQITFMEIGGNAKAKEYFSKQGLSLPYDYKSPIVDKYKQAQIKKTDALLVSNDSNAKVEKVEEKIQTPVENVISNSSSAENKPENVANPFNNVKIDKEQTKTKGFTVEFTKNKQNSTTSKGRLAAKKIDNIDIDSLTLLEEDSKSSISSMVSLDNAETSMGPKHEPATKEEEILEVKTTTKNNNNNNNNETDEETLKKFRSAKSISSSSFRGNQSENQDPNVNSNRFANATAISSDMYFGQNNKDSKIDQTVDNAKEFFSNVGEKFSNVGGKLKEKAGVVGTVFSDMNTKLVSKWQDRNKHLEKK